MYEIIDELGYRDRVSGVNSARTQQILEDSDKFLFELPVGHLHRDRQFQKYTMVGFQLGVPGDTFSEDTKKKYKFQVTQDIYMGDSEKNMTFTTMGRCYITFLRDVFYERDEKAYLLVGPSLRRVEVFEGPLDLLLDILELGWRVPYEWTIMPPDLRWAVDYNHHHSMVIVGDVEADRAYNLLGRKRWEKYAMGRNLYPRTPKK